MPTLNPSERDLIRRAQAGEAEAVAALFRANALVIFRYCYYRVRDYATAEDLAGEVFVKMVEGLPRYVDQGRPVLAWLFRIAHDRVVDHHRREARRPTEPLTPALEAPSPGTEAQAMQRAELGRVQALLAGLTEEQRLVIQLRFVEGYDLEECAHILGKTPGAIKGLQHRALRHLADRLEL